MLNALITGTLATDPKSGTSKSGTEWANAVIRCPCGQNRETGDQESAFVQIACFGSEAAKLARLTKGDSVSAAGALKPSEYVKNGETRHGLSMTANQIMSAYTLAKKRDSTPKPDRTPDREQVRAYGDFVKSATRPTGEDFNDSIPF